MSKITGNEPAMPMLERGYEQGIEVWRNIPGLTIRQQFAAMAQSRYDFKAIRAEIFKEHKDEIIADLNADHLERIAELEKEIQLLKERMDY